ncbi:MAG: glycoside hydrolase family 43 protein [Acidimicrobiales bacterium]
MRGQLVSSRPTSGRARASWKAALIGAVMLGIGGVFAFAPGAGHGSTGRVPGEAAAAAPLASSGARRPAAHPVTRLFPPHADMSSPGVLVLDRNLPDPVVVEQRGRYYLYSSQTGFDTPPVSLTTSDGPTLLRWEKTATALATVPSWAETGFTWAPDVRMIDGRYVMYFDAWAEKSMYFRADESGFSQRAQCIGVATAGGPAGPFTPVAGPPLVCQFNHHGAIDPRTFLAPDGRLYLDWKSDDNADPGSPPTHLWAQELSKNGERPMGARHLLMSGSRRVWDGGLVEAPDMVYAVHTYWLFYSGSWFNGPGYSIGVAKCSGPEGPCRPSSARPWLAANSQGGGPGEESLFHNSQGWWMVYSPWSLYKHDYRPVELAKVFFAPSGPYLAKIPA